MGFKWRDDITIDANDIYTDINIPMDTLKSYITK